MTKKPEAMTFSDVFLIASHCQGRAGLYASHESLWSGGKSVRELDAMLLPELDRDDVLLSLLEDTQLEQFNYCWEAALQVIRTHQMGCFAACGCFVVLWYTKPKEAQ